MKASAALLLLVAAYAHAGEPGYNDTQSQVSRPVSYICQGVVTVTIAGRESSTYYITQPITVPPEQVEDLAEAWGVHLDTKHQYLAAGLLGWNDIDACRAKRERGFEEPGQRCRHSRPVDRIGQVVVARNCIELTTDPSTWQTYRHSLIEENNLKGIAMVENAFTYGGPLPPDDRLMYFCESWSSDHKTLYLSSLFVANPPTLKMSPVVSAWRAYAANTLGLKGGWASGCHGGIGLEGIEKHDGRRELLAVTAGATLHEVNWTFSAAAPTP